ncbi:MAG: carbohydrate kinase [Porphyromonadaceae bacterium]|nr:MAG: carbohydrate kinase [Porphyromonadaceae bacterium]
MIKKPIVAGIGELLWDMLPAGKQLGGAPCNFAFHAMQAGCESYVISAIGQDELGTELIKTLNHLGLSDQYIQKNSFPTSTVTIKLDDQGHPDYTIHEQVAWDHIQWNAQIEKLAGELDAVCFGSLAQRSFESEHSVVSLISATKPGCLKVFDINLRQHYYTKEIIIQSINLSDVLKLNEDELPVVAGYTGLSGDIRSQLTQLLKQFNLRYIVYTMGSKGSIIVSADEYSFIEAPRIRVTDTVGAGDAFTAVFIAGLLKGYPLTEVHQKAAEIAALVCTKKGATPKLSIFIF